MSCDESGVVSVMFDHERGRKFAQDHDDLSSLVTIAAIQLGEALGRIMIAVAFDCATIFASTSDIIGAATKCFANPHQYSRGALTRRSHA